MNDNIARAKAPPRKRIALFIDGTWNVEKNNTNIWRLYSLCAAQDGNEVQQVSYYTKGVGTLYGEKFRGGIFGAGFNDLIVEAYEWLIQHFNPGDDIFLFGFSRGAYAARGLAGFIAKCGILHIGSPISVDELFSRYRKHGDARTLYRLFDDRDKGQLGATTQLEDWMLRYCYPAPILMVGVWDTVRSLVGFYDFIESGLREPLKNVYHAMAIDEHRRGFKPTLYTRNFHLDQPSSAQAKERDISGMEQRWFVGAHANVGGGYDSDLLCQAPLLWIARKAKTLGLTFRGDIILDKDPFACHIQNSFWSFMWHLYFLGHAGIKYFRVVGEPDRKSERVITENVNETIDQSVFERWRRDKKYRPKNLKRWQRLYNVDPARLMTSVWAKSPDRTAPD